MYPRTWHQQQHDFSALLMQAMPVHSLTSSCASRRALVYKDLTKAATWSARCRGGLCQCTDSMLTDLLNQACCGYYHTEEDEPHKLGAGAAALLVLLLAVAVLLLLLHWRDSRPLLFLLLLHCNCHCTPAVGGGRM